MTTDKKTKEDLKKALFNDVIPLLSEEKFFFSIDTDMLNKFWVTAVQKRSEIIGKGQKSSPEVVNMICV